ncbi:MAG TPA: hypothetical protein VGM37_06765 [Armatimonadota bacterium]|jgi:hypothetical protein
MENEGRLRALIQLIPPARALRDDLDQSLHLETYGGIGDAALSTLEGLRASIARITDDPFVATLTVAPLQTAGDKEKVALARLTAGQLLAYLEGQTGLSGSGGNGGGTHINIQRAPVINLSNVRGVASDVLERVMGMGAKPKGKGEKEEEEDEDGSPRYG